MIGAMDNEQSWVCKWQKINHKYADVYAISVTGSLPSDLIRDLRALKINYQPIPRIRPNHWTCPYVAPAPRTENPTINLSNVKNCQPKLTANAKTTKIAATNRTVFILTSHSNTITPNQKDQCSLAQRP
uniref:Spt4 domain-containing protein n=1 Tax=Panagrellus redivivus TaxID=6233 RepID=A0A7E4W3P9_PANRE